MRVTYPLLLLFGSAGQAATRRHVFTIQSKPLSPDGVLREGYLINGQFPGPLIEAEEGDTVEVLVRNEASVSNTIHWHGILQKGTPQMDGVPGVTQEPIAPGASFLYRFSLHDQYGPYWYHSHYRAYYGDGISGPFIIHPSPNRTRSFRSLASNTDEYERLLHVERSAQFVMMNDWRHKQSDQILGEYLTTGNYPFCVDSLLINGKARIECLTEDMLRVLSQELVVPSQNLSLQGCTKPMMLRDGFDARDFQTQSCSNTTSDLTVIMADPSAGWVALHLANTGLVSDISFSIDGHSLIIYAVDGIYVDLSEVQVLPVSIGQRYSVLVKLDQSPGSYFIRAAAYPFGDTQQILQSKAILKYKGAASTPDYLHVKNSASNWMHMNGSARGHALTLPINSLAPFDKELNRPPSGPANITRKFSVSQTGITTWVMDRAPYVEAAIPILAGNASDGWTIVTTQHFPSNATIDLVLEISNHSMDSMGHPFHLHGHKFWILGWGSGNFPASTTAEAPLSQIDWNNPPYRDTFVLPQGGWVAIRYITDNPGAWIFHCHIEWHLMTGLAVVLVEGADQFLDS